MATNVKPTRPLKVAYRVFSSSGNTLLAQVVIAALLALIAFVGSIASSNGVRYQFSASPSCVECR